MLGGMNFHDNQPISYWGRVPVYVTTLVTAAFVVGVVLTAILVAAASPALGWLGLTVPLMAYWSLWQCITYVFIETPSFFTPLGLMCFYSFGVGIETHIGRQQFIRLLLVLTLVLPASFLLLYALQAGPSAYKGNYMLLVGLVIAFSTLYPNTEFWGWVPMKYVAFVCLFCGSLMEIAARQFLHLLSLWVVALAAYLFIRNYQGFGPLALVSEWWANRGTSLRLVKKPQLQRSFRTVRKTQPTDPRAEVDKILEKIANEGISSLSEREKQILEEASRRMKGKKG